MSAAGLRDGRVVSGSNLVCGPDVDDAAAVEVWYC